MHHNHKVNSIRARRADLIAAAERVGLRIDAEKGRNPVTPAAMALRPDDPGDRESDCVLDKEGNWTIVGPGEAA